MLLTFSGNVVDPAPTLVLLDAAGAEVRGGEPVVEGATVALPLPDGLPNGAYTVQWGIVSSDGDPVSGDFAFTVAAPATAAPPPSPSRASSSETSAAPSPAYASPVGAVAGGDPSVGPWLVGGAAAAALLVGRAGRAEDAHPRLRDQPANGLTGSPRTPASTRNSEPASGSSPGPCPRATS